MNNFIKLTAANSDAIYINMDNIESFGIINEHTYKYCQEYLGMTYLVPIGLKENENPYIVQEAPECIINMW